MSGQVGRPRKQAEREDTKGKAALADEAGEASKRQRMNGTRAQRYHGWDNRSKQRLSEKQVERE